MPGQFVVNGRHYPFPDAVKMGEARLIKQIAGIGTAEIPDALERGDPDVLAAMLMIAMRRAGRPVTLEQLDEMELGSITFEGDEQEDEDGPPADAAVTAAANGNSATIPSPSGSQPTEPIST